MVSRAGARSVTTDTLSLSNPRHGRAAAACDGHASSATSRGSKPKALQQGGSIGGARAYHGSALTTELRARRSSTSRFDGVVPFRVEGVAVDLDGGQVLV